MRWPAADRKRRPHTPMTSSPISVACVDLAGAEALWNGAPEATAEGIALLDAALSGALDDHGGRRLATPSAAFFAAFDDAFDAVRWGCAIQQSLLELEWPAALLDQEHAGVIRTDAGQVLYRGLRVQVGIDFGRVFTRRAPFSGDVQYVGKPVERARELARLSDPGHVVVSVGAHHIVGEERWRHFDPEVHELREFSSGSVLCESGFLVLPRPLAGRIDLRVSGAPRRRTNLPEYQTSFVDRAVELSALSEHFATGARWVTMVGPAGVGKTRMAVEFASQWLRESGPGSREAWFCDLTAAHDLKAAMDTIARAVQLQLPATDSSEKAGHLMAAALRDRGDALIVLDNAEHLVDALAPLVQGWIGNCPQLLVLVTSRRRFDQPLEVAHRLDSMSEEAALALLVDRLSQARGAHVKFGAEDRAALRQLSRRCAQLPLAIELVAAGGRLLSPRELLEIWSGEHGGEASSQLDRAIERTWNLLKPWEKEALTHCAVFAGGFSVAAAERVLAPSSPDAPPTIEVLEALHGHSLLRTPPGTERATRTRLALYEPIREFVLAREPADSVDTARKRHMTFFTAWAKREAQRMRGDEELGAVERLTEELSNLQQAFLFACDHDRERAVRLVVVLGELDRRVGPLAGQMDRVETAVEIADELGDVALQVGARCARARARRWLHQFDRAFDDFQDALALAEDAGQTELEIEPLLGLAAVTHRLGRHAQTERYAQRTLDLVEGSDSPEEVTALQLVGVLHSWRGDRDEAARLLNQAQLCARHIGNPSALAETLALYGPALTAHFKYDEAARYMEEALEIFRALHNRRKMVVIIFQLAFVYTQTGRHERAERAYAQALEIIETAGLSKADRGALLRGRGETRFWRGRYAEAEADLTQALALIDKGSVVRLLYARAYLAATLAQQDRRAEARDHFEHVVAELEDMDLPTERSMARTLRGYLYAAEARHAHAKGDASAAQTALNQAFASVEAGENSAHTAFQDEARRLRDYLDEIIDAGLVPAPGTSSGPVFEVAADTRWFRFGDAEPVDITRRGALRRILHELVDRRLTAPGEPVSLDEVIEFGWPGETIMPDSGARRVYTTINRLRELGVHDIVLTTDDGYMLDPDVTVRREG